MYYVLKNYENNVKTSQCLFSAHQVISDHNGKGKVVPVLN
jgi:hypothetical protein